VGSLHPRLGLNFPQLHSLPQISPNRQNSQRRGGKTRTQYEAYVPQVKTTQYERQKYSLSSLYMVCVHEPLESHLTRVSGVSGESLLHSLSGARNKHVRAV